MTDEKKIPEPPKWRVVVDGLLVKELAEAIANKLRENAPPSVKVRVEKVG